MVQMDKRNSEEKWTDWGKIAKIYGCQHKAFEFFPDVIRVTAVT